MHSAATLHAERGHAHPTVGALRDVPHAVHDRARRRRGRRSARCPSKCRIRSGCTATTARRTAARAATCRRSPPKRRSPPCSANRGRSVSQHTFLGGNAFMLDILRRHRGELGVTALPQELEAAAAETRRFLGTRAATLAIAAAQRTAVGLELALDITSTTGHKLPTAYPSRRAWLHVVVRDAAGRVVFESGADAARRQHRRATTTTPTPCASSRTTRSSRAPTQVQIYEAIMVDRAVHVTTGLLRGVRFVKDNRLLPRGFDKSTAEPDIAVHGDAAADADFVGGGDRVRYRVALDAGEAAPADRRRGAALSIDRLSLGREPARLCSRGNAAVRRATTRKTRPLRRRRSRARRRPCPRADSGATGFAGAAPSNGTPDASAKEEVVRSHSS